MFERIKGIIEETKADYVVVGTPTFSYRIYISLRTLQHLPQIGEDVMLYLHPVFKDTDITLYGFDNAEDRAIFKDLISVNKVGPRTGMALLSLYDHNDLISHIRSGKIKELTRAAGLGKKGAEMIVASLRDKYKGYIVSEPEKEEEGAVERMRIEDQVFNEAVAALTSLGYSWEIASEAVGRSYHSGITVEELLKASLAAMSEL